MMRRLGNRDREKERGELALINHLFLFWVILVTLKYINKFTNQANGGSFTHSDTTLEDCFNLFPLKLVAGCCLHSLLTVQQSYKYILYTHFVTNFSSWNQLWVNNYTVESSCPFSSWQHLPAWNHLITHELPHASGEECCLVSRRNYLTSKRFWKLFLKIVMTTKEVTQGQFQKLYKRRMPLKAH